MSGAIFGRSRMTTTSRLTISKPASRTIAAARRSRSTLDASFHAGSVSGKVPADVAERGRAEHRVGRRVADDVGVGVPEGAERRRDAHAAEDQRPSLDEPVQIVPGADARRRRDPASPARGVEIRGRRDLHVAGVPRNHVHGMPGPLGEHRFVGRRRRRRARARRRRRAPRAGRPAASAPGRSSRAGSSRSRRRAAVRRASPCRATGERRRSPRRAPRPHRSMRAIRSGVTNGRAASCTSTMSDRGVHAVERVGDRILPPRSALDDAQRPRRPTLSMPAAPRPASAGSTTMTSVTRSWPSERVDAALENRAATDLEQLLRHARRPAGGRRRRRR